MLERYLDMLKKAFSALVNIGGSDATILDYFHVVGYELLVLMIGIIYIALIVALIVIPIVFVKRLYWNYDNMSWHKHMRKVDEYMKFRRQYEDLVKDLKKYDKNNDLSKKARAILNKIYELLDSKNIAHISPNLQDVKLSYVLNGLPELPYCGYYDTEKLPGDFEDVTDTGIFINFEIMDNLCSAWVIIRCILFVLIYAIFVIPLVLMFIR